MKIKAMLRERESPGGRDPQERELLVEAETYEEAYAAMLEQIPLGWVHLWVDIDRT